MRLIDADDLTADISSMRVYVGGKDITDPEYRDSVLTAIVEAPTVNVLQWVSVKDRLPDCKGEYLVAYHSCYWDNVIEETVVGYDSYRGGARWARNKYQRVTHWMPMPQLPEVTLCEND